MPPSPPVHRIARNREAVFHGGVEKRRAPLSADRKVYLPLPTPPHPQVYTGSPTKHTPPTHLHSSCQAAFQKYGASCLQQPRSSDGRHLLTFAFLLSSLSSLTLPWPSASFTPTLSHAARMGDRSALHGTSPQDGQSGRRTSPHPPILTDPITRVHCGSA